MSKTISMQIKIDAAPERVFKALTNNSDLEEWFAENADVSISNDRYDFWGKFTPENPERDQGSHAIEGCEDEKSLRFKWFLKGAETSVSYDLANDGTSTLFTVNHTDVPARKEGEMAVANFWSTTLENLRNWVERGVVGLRCDFSEVNMGDVSLQLEVSAPGKDVFEALIEPAQLERYMATKATVEPVKGGRYDFGWGGGPIKILDIEPGKRLDIAWKWGEEPETVVTWELEDSGGKTRLTLVHSGFGAKRVSDDYRIGWAEYVNKIKFMVEVGAGWTQAKILSEDHQAECD